MSRFALLYMLSTLDIISSYLFSQFNSLCLNPENTFVKMQVPSVIVCACICAPSEKCNMFAWTNVSQECLIQSEQSSDPYTDDLGILTWYNKKPLGGVCQRVGYMYDHITNSCIKIGESTDSLTWEDSREECQKDGGDLISITSYEKMDFIMNNIKCLSTAAWIGFRNKTWLTGEIVSSDGFNATRLNNLDQDHKFDNDSSCGCLMTAAIFVIQDKSCHMRKHRNFICEILS